MLNFSYIQLHKVKTENLNSNNQGHCDPLKVLKLVNSQALQPDSLQTLMYHLIFFTGQLQM
jgi:hypothetical protein